MPQSRLAAGHARTAPRQPLNGILRVTCSGDASERTLARLDALVTGHPEDVDLRFARACLLEDLGRAAQARVEYMNVLRRDARHLGALTNLATMYFATNRRTHARVLFEYCARYHPGNALAEGNLAAARAAR